MAWPGNGAMAGPMQIGKGVEWAVHACALLGALGENEGLRAEALAAYHGVPRAYMAKQLQALSKAGLVQTVKGARGGYRLARAPGEISLWDIMAAVEGSGPAFTCTEIRQNGPCGAAPEACKTPCPIARGFREAETAYRAVLKGITVADMARDAAADMTEDQAMRIMTWAQANVVRLQSK